MSTVITWGVASNIDVDIFYQTICVRYVYKQRYYTYIHIHLTLNKMGDDHGTLMFAVFPLICKHDLLLWVYTGTFSQSRKYQKFITVYSMFVIHYKSWNKRKHSYFHNHSEMIHNWEISLNTSVYISLCCHLPAIVLTYIVEVYGFTN